MITNITTHQEDLPQEILSSLGSEVAIDTETLGLNLNRDRLCLVQLKGISSNDVHLIQFASNKCNAPNLAHIISNDKITKVYHFARFDIAVILKFLGVLSNNNYCTKVASHIARTYSNRHGLKDLCAELLGIKLNKAQQSSYWANSKLSSEQLEYASNDVIYLSDLKASLNKILEKEKRQALADSCMTFLTTRALLDVLGWDNIDVFAHNITNSNN